MNRPLGSLGERGLSYLQVMLLIVGFLAASIFIFLLGYGVGQEMALRHTLLSERVVRGSAVPRAATPAPTVGVDASFYKDLQEKAEKQIEAAEAAVSPSPAPSFTAAVPAIVATVARPSATPARPASPKPTATRKPTAAAAPGLRPTSAPVLGQSRWSIEVTSTKNAQEAIALTLELRRQGYQAFTAQAVGKDVSYRVRVGRFGSREEAEGVERKLKQDPRFSGAYITSQ